MHCPPNEYFNQPVHVANRLFKLTPVFPTCDTSKTSLQGVLNELLFQTDLHGIKYCTSLRSIMFLSFSHQSLKNLAKPKSCNFLSEDMTANLTSGDLSSFLT